MEALKILLADDNSKFRNSAIRYLNSSLNFELLTWAESGEDALKKMEAFNPNLIIMDISMNGINGFETTKKIRRTNIKVKIIVLTLGKDLEYRNQALAAGADDFITKSDFGPVLLEKIERIFGKSTIKKSSKSK
jgi:two-component system, NarL family, response regulator DegU